MMRKPPILFVLFFLMIQQVKGSEDIKHSSIPFFKEIINSPLDSLSTNNYSFSEKKVKKTAINSNSIFDFIEDKTEYLVSKKVTNDRGIALKFFEVIEKEQAWVNTFSNEDVQKLPVGVKYTKENIQYAIGVTKASIYKSHTELTVFARVKLPQTDKNGVPIELFFGANNVKLSHKGGIIGDANLVLLGDINIPLNTGKWMFTLKGGFDYESGYTDNRTYVTINCSGIKDLTIEGEVEFSRSLIIPVESYGEVEETKTHITKRITTENGIQSIEVPHRVKGSFKTTIINWNDLLVSINIQPFTLAKKRNKKNYDGNFQFYANEAILDFSDFKNDPNVIFPNHYLDNGLLLPNEKTWRGLYIHALEVKLPKEFKTTKTISEDKRIAFGAYHLLIDSYGVSGSFYADNLFPLKEGRTNKSKGWAYSLDNIDISLEANRLTKAEFNGQILLPVSKNEERLGLNYYGLISEEEYILNVSNDSAIDFDLWKAKGELLPNSAIELKIKDGEFEAKAVLHGRLAISANKEDTGNQSNQDNLVEFKGIEFQNLVLKTKGTMFSVDYMGYKGQSKLSNFPISISEIGITANEYNANLYFNLGINLMGENNGFSAQTSLDIIGSFREKNHKQKWTFEGLELRAIALDADLGGFSMQGSLVLMDDDPEYGNGFAASLTAQFKAGKGIDVGVKGVFGKKDFRYWQFEAMVDNLPPGTGTGMLNLEGFAGGASYRMRRSGFSSSFSPSGIGYVPDETVGLGVKAMVLFNAVKKEVLKGGAGFEIVFNRNGGVNFLGFYGQAAFMSVSIPGMDKVSSLIDKVKENTTAKKSFLGVTNENTSNSWVGKKLLDKASGDFPQTPPGDIPISAKVAITYDFENDVLHGELDAYVNVPGGFLEGRGSEGRAGWAVLHFDPKEWYIYIGTPEDRLGLRMGVGSISVKTGGYFMTGSKLPGSPPPPPEVASILGVDAQELNYMRKENLLKNGGGFAFGSDISIDTGDLRFLIFYARFQAGAGFDIMLKNYEKAKCVNTGKQVGINGWYANGQAYAYLQGELGIRIKLFFIKKKVPIIRGGAAVLLQAKAPNPIWMKGYMAGNFDILGGMVKGRYRFKLTIGEECVFEDASPLGGLKIITDVTPDNDTKEVDVFAIPQASFSMKVGEPIIIPEDDGDKTYKITLEKFQVLHEGKEIEGALEWSRFRDVANFVSTDILPPNEELIVKVEVSFKEKIAGVFRAILVDGEPAIEREEIRFKTGGAPDVIPLHNISYSYPVVNQKYFLEKESSKGYIQLKRGQDYLFDNTQWRSSLSYKEEETQKSNEFDFIYSTSDNKIAYELPSISQSLKYNVSIVSEPKNVNKKTNNINEYKQVKLGDDTNENTVSIQQKKSENISKEGVIERLTYNFSTSKYQTFKQKVNSIKTKDYRWGVIYSDVIYLGNQIKNHEPFDVTDLLGSSYTNNKPLVTIAATLDDSYFMQDINPPLYSKYPMLGYKIKNRDENILGAPPRLALPLIDEYVNNLENDVNQGMLETTFPYRYNLGLIYKSDWVDLQAQLVNAHLDGAIKSNNTVLNFLDEDYLFMRYGFYKTRLIYMLPGNLKGSEAIYEFKNPNKFR